MTILSSIAQFTPALLVLFVAAAVGFALLALVGIGVDDAIEAILFACGLGFFVIGIGVLALSLPGWLNRETAWVLVATIGVVAGSHWKTLFSAITQIAKQTRWNLKNGDLWIRLTLAGIAVLALFEELLASAPLSGSDAMHYHFTVPLREMGKPLSPLFDLTNSFLTGQAHLLISLGLALGSDRTALELIFLGGLLTALGLFAFARQLMPLRWALAAILTFLATPMVFWQITTSGSPDIWMGFYIALALLAESRGVEKRDSRLLILSGLFAGNAAAVKYTGWIVPLAVCGYLLAFYRPRRTAFHAAIAAILGGAFPHVRNFLWTRDPVFPFLTRWLNPSHVNHYALNALLTETRSRAFSLAPGRILAFPFMLTLNGNELGLGQYFGPIVLALAPALIFVPWKNRVAQLCGITGCLIFAANAITTQMGRFLLPAYPVAIVLAFAGSAELASQGWNLATRACSAMVALFLVFACAADALYAKPFLRVIVGREHRIAFLERMAPDFQFATFVNDTLGQRTAAERGETLVFFRHLFYLRVPYVNGDPTSSWTMDPGTCGDPNGLLHCLREQNVRWVVSAPDFPESLAGAFAHLAATGDLVPIANANLESLAGTTRMESTRVAVEVTIWQLRR